MDNKTNLHPNILEHVFSVKSKQKIRLSGETSKSSLCSHPPRAATRIETRPPHHLIRLHLALESTPGLIRQDLKVQVETLAFKPLGVFPAFRSLVGSMFSLRASGSRKLEVTDRVTWYRGASCEKACEKDRNPMNIVKDGHLQRFCVFVLVWPQIRLVSGTAR